MREVNEIGSSTLGWTAVSLSNLFSQLFSQFNQDLEGEIPLSSCFQNQHFSGAFVIGTTSTEAKAAKAREAGADEVILYSQRDFAEEVNRITDGKGVNVIYDGIGKKTFEKGMKWIECQGYLYFLVQVQQFPDLSQGKISTTEYSIIFYIMR